MNIFEDKNLFKADLEGTISEVKVLLSSLESLVKMEQKLDNLSETDIEDIKTFATKIDVVLDRTSGWRECLVNEVIDSFISTEEDVLIFMESSDNFNYFLESQQEELDNKYGVERPEDIDCDDFCDDECECECHQLEDEFNGDDEPELH